MLKRIQAHLCHKAARNAFPLLLISIGHQQYLRGAATVVFTKASSPNHGPIQTAPLKTAFTQPLTNKNQAKQIKGMKPTASTEEAHQHHALQPQKAAGLNLGVHTPSVHLQGTNQIGRRASTRGNNQGRATLESMKQRLRRFKLQRRTSKRPSCSARARAEGSKEVGRTMALTD